MSVKTFLIGIALVAASGSVQAQGWVEAPNVVRERSSVAVRVHDNVAVVEVEEWFRNRGGNLGEGDYMYPLPAGAVFTSYSLFQGDKEMRGEMLDATQARRIYEEIVRRKKDPALIELVGYGLVRARVFPLAAGETRRVVLRYSQPLQRAGDALEFRYPSNRASDNAVVNLVVTIENGAAYRNAVSATHDLTVRRERGQMVVRPKDALHSDFALLLPMAARDVGVAMSTHRGSASEDGFFMLRLTPGEVAEAARVSRDVTVVVDVSGSMSGDKLIQAKAALRQLLGTLGTDDRFRLIKFSGASDEWRDSWTRADGEELRAANRWVDDLRADGGTNIGEALADAFRMPATSSRLSVVVFLTDGLPSVGETNAERIAAIAKRSAGSTRVFAFGVGQDVNTYLLDGLGAAGRGSAQYVQPGENVETALGALANKIRFPVLTDLSLVASGISLREIYPTTMPDLFGGEDLVVFGRYRAGDSRIGRGGPSARGSSTNAVITITGQRAGKPERYSTRISVSGDDDGNDYMPRLWAARKLGELTRRVHLDGRNPELIAEIKSTALRYGLLSEYTSYFVTEPVAIDAIRVRGSRAALVPRDQVSSKSVVTGNTAAAAPAPPPSQSTGGAAVASAESARKQREVGSAGELDAQQRAAAARMLPTNGLAQVDVTSGGVISTARGVAGGKADGKEGGKVSGGVGTRQIVAGRSFILRDSVWTDIAIDPSAKSLDIVAFSDAYFALLRELPEVKAYTGLDMFAIAGDKMTIRVLAAGSKIPAAASGVTKLSDTELAAIVKQFRGVSPKS